jgi:hypothetical protein
MIRNRHPGAVPRDPDGESGGPLSPFRLIRASPSDLRRDQVESDRLAVQRVPFNTARGLAPPQAGQSQGCGERDYRGAKQDLVALSRVRGEVLHLLRGGGHHRLR